MRIIPPASKAPVSASVTDVDVAGDMTWFAKHHIYPVRVEVTGDSIKYNDEAYRKIPAPDGGFHISKARSGVCLGTVTPEGVTPSLSRHARRTLQVMRAALLGTEYLLPVAFKVDRQYIHAGECWRDFNEENRPSRASALYDVKSDKVCVVCEDGWDM